MRYGRYVYLASISDDDGVDVHNNNGHHVYNNVDRHADNNGHHNDDAVKLSSAVCIVLLID